MNKKLLTLIFIFIAGLLCLTPAGICEERDKKVNPYIAAYPNYLSAVNENYLIWKDGTKMIYDDRRNGKTFEEMLENGDLEDQLSMTYPINGGADYVPSENFDPGRIRFVPFFQKMYGSTEDEVKRNLTEIRWMPRSSDRAIVVTTVNNIHLKLQKISDELDRLPDNSKKYVSDLSGTFTWRNIAGTDRLSMHSFGIAIDINTKYADYWRWSKPLPTGDYKYRNRIPLDIVRIFEKHGFIWGGRWYHSDTMHFEYRPELLIEKKQLQ